MLYTYTEAQEKYGSSYQIEREIKKGKLFKIARGLYSLEAKASPYAIISKVYPDAIITMDSAFYIHNLTDVIPNKIHLATRRNALRIRDKSIQQYFLEERFFEQGRTLIDHDRTTISIYSLERMLVELMRSSTSMPLDYYKEIISHYRNKIDEMDIYTIEEYMTLFERNDYMFDILQKEVL